MWGYPTQIFILFCFNTWNAMYMYNSFTSGGAVGKIGIKNVHVYDAIWVTSFFSSPEPKARVSYCHIAPSVVRPSVRPSSSSVVRKLFTFSTSSPKPQDGFWWNLVGMKYSWSLTSVVVFRPDPSRGGPGRGKNRSWGSPSSTNFFFRLEGYIDKMNA